MKTYGIPVGNDGRDFDCCATPVAPAGEEPSWHPLGDEDPQPGAKVRGTRDYAEYRVTYEFHVAAASHSVLRASGVTGQMFNRTAFTWEIWR